jgi:hypothetical protein
VPLLKNVSTLSADDVISWVDQIQARRLHLARAQYSSNLERLDILNLDGYTL